MSRLAILFTSAAAVACWGPSHGQNRILRNMSWEIRVSEPNGMQHMFTLLREYVQTSGSLQWAAHTVTGLNISSAKNTLTDGYNGICKYYLTRFRFRSINHSNSFIQRVL